MSFQKALLLSLCFSVVLLQSNFAKSAGLNSSGNAANSGKFSVGNGRNYLQPTTSPQNQNFGVRATSPLKSGLNIPITTAFGTTSEIAAVSRKPANSRDTDTASTAVAGGGDGVPASTQYEPASAQNCAEFYKLYGNVKYSDYIQSICKTESTYNAGGIKDGDKQNPECVARFAKYFACDNPPKENTSCSDFSKAKAAISELDKACKKSSSFGSIGTMDGKASSRAEQSQCYVNASNCPKVNRGDFGQCVTDASFDSKKDCKSLIKKAKTAAAVRARGTSTCSYMADADPDLYEGLYKDVLDELKTMKDDIKQLEDSKAELQTDALSAATAVMKQQNDFKKAQQDLVNKAQAQAEQIDAAIAENINKAKDVMLKAQTEVIKLTRQQREAEIEVKTQLAQARAKCQIEAKEKYNAVVKQKQNMVSQNTYKSNSIGGLVANQKKLNGLLKELLNECYSSDAYRDSIAISQDMKNAKEEELKANHAIVTQQMQAIQEATTQAQEMAKQQKAKINQMLQQELANLQQDMQQAQIEAMNQQKLQEQKRQTLAARVAAASEDLKNKQTEANNMACLNSCSLQVEGGDSKEKGKSIAEDILKILSAAGDVDRECDEAFALCGADETTRKRMPPACKAFTGDGKSPTDYIYYPDHTRNNK